MDERCRRDGTRIGEQNLLKFRVAHFLSDEVLSFDRHWHSLTQRGYSAKAEKTPHWVNPKQPYQQSLAGHSQLVSPHFATSEAADIA